MRLYKNKYLIIICAVLLSGVLYSQNFRIFGKVVDEIDSSIVGAVVGLYKQSDSSLVSGETTNPRGMFRFMDIPPANDYFIKISYVGYKDYFSSFTLTDNKRIGKIKLTPKNNTLKEVEVKTQAIMATQSGDTTSFNSNAFKVNKDATAEDLINKMPGITNVDGKVNAQGEEVKQVLVDGKPFFGDDPSSVLKNLPAEVIDKIQVFDKKSDQAQFTGFDDGNTSKTINIITKVQFRNGIFGKAYGGYGYENKYKGGVAFNRFNNDQRISILGMSNNINEQNFSTEDLVGVMSSGGSNSRGNSRGGGSRGGGSYRGGGGYGGNNSDNFLVNASNGISTTHAFGINYSDVYNTKTNLSVSYFANMADNRALSNTNRNYFLQQSNGLNYTQGDTAFSRNINNRLSIRFEHKIDSFLSVLLQPKLSFQYNDGYNNTVGINKDTALIKRIDKSFKSTLNGASLSFPILVRKSFPKRGRTISLDYRPTYNPQNGNSNYQSYNTNYFNPVSYDTIDQVSTYSKYDFNNSATLNYTEPISEFGSLSFDYQLTYNMSDSKKDTYDKNPQLSDYSLRDSLVSNVFNSSYQANLGRVSFRYRNKKLFSSIGVSSQEATLNKIQTFPNQLNASRTFYSVLPNLFMRYNIDRNRNLRIFYRTNNNAPSIDQLQNVLNNSNALQLSIGNPDLKQDFQQSFSMRYSSVNTEKSHSFFAMVSGDYRTNYIGNQTIIARKDTVVFGDIFLSKGGQIMRPTNFSNSYSIRGFLNYSFPLKAIKSNLNINPGYNFSYIPARINDIENITKSSSPSFGLVISSNISEKIDFLLSSNSSYNDTRNSLKSNSSYYSQSSKAKLNITLFKRLVISTEYTNTFYNGLSASYNQNINLLNGAMAVKLFKDNRAELRLFVFDILNQNQSIQRNITDTYIEDVHTNILQRYFMLTFTYNFRKYFTKDEKSNSYDRSQSPNGH